MAEKPMIYRIYDDLVKAVSGIGKKTFLERPSTLQQELTDFVVITIPTEIRQRVKGGSDFRSGAYGLFSVYCKAKTDGTINIGAQSSLVEQVINVFPIAGETIEASNPTILMRGDDGYGYQVTQITFKLRTIKS